jgi:translation initiation factor 2 beta subunit (eIF-2beta)/eIF-5
MKYQRELKRSAARIAIYMYIRFYKPIKKCGGLEKKLKNKIRHTFVNMSLMMAD